MAKFYLSIPIICLAAVSVNAAEITVLSNNNPTPEVGKIIRLSGEITLGDDLRLIAALDNAPPNSLVVLTSPGGLIAPAMAMGRIIRKSGANTIASEVCASACGLIWLAGTKRFTYSDAQIGFHAAYSGNNASVTGTGNALIGAYVSELGFGDNVIRYVTEKPPEGMQWLNEREANLLGVDVVTLPRGEFNNGPSNQNEEPSIIPKVSRESPVETTPETSEKIEKLAVEFAYQIVAEHLNDTASALSYVGKNYADQVNYYGKSLSLTQVLLDKQAYMDRWPIRETRIRNESIQSNCDATTCLVTGVYDWAVSNPNLKKKSFGSATFGYGFILEPQVRVIYEEGKVLKRN